MSATEVAFESRASEPRQAISELVGLLYDASSGDQRLVLVTQLLKPVGTSTIDGGVRGIFAMAQVRLACSKTGLRPTDLDRVSGKDVADLARFVECIDEHSLRRLPVAVERCTMFEGRPEYLALVRAVREVEDATAIRGAARL